MAPYSLFYFLVDSLVVQQAVSWFNVRVPYRDILPVRATTYILSLINTQLGQGGVAVYLHRRYGIPFWEITGTVVFIMFVEVYQLALYSFVGAAAAGELATGRAPLVVYAVMAAYLVVPRARLLVRALAGARPHPVLHGVPEGAAAALPAGSSC
jgi:hypothetical protein